MKAAIRQNNSTCCMSSQPSLGDPFVEQLTDHGSRIADHGIHLTVQPPLQARDGGPVPLISQEAAATHDLDRRSCRDRNMSADQIGSGEIEVSNLSPEEEALIVTFRQAHVAAARRLPLSAAGNPPAPDPLYVGRSRNMTSADCQASKERGRERDSRPTRLAISTSTSQKCAPKRASSTCWWPLTASASSPLPSFTNTAHCSQVPPPLDRRRAL
jgi:hypothetical protein